MATKKIKSGIDLGLNPESKHFDNLAKGLSDSDQTRIAEEILNGIDQDLGSISQLKILREKYTFLFNLQQKQKNEPWVNASNVILPTITNAVNNFGARASLNLFPDAKIAKIFQLDSSQRVEEMAARVEKHLNWQLNYDMPDFLTSFKKSLSLLALDGYAFRKVFWDSINDRVDSQLILPEDLIVNYYSRDLESSARYTHVLHMTENDIRIKGEQGIYINTEDLEFVPDSDGDTETMKRKRDQGLTQPDPDYATPSDVYECFTWIKERERDKIRKPVIVTIHKTSRKILRLVNRTHPEKQNEVIKYIQNYEFLPNPVSLYGFGFGPLLFTFNNVMNSAMNQLIDAGTLSNTKSGYIQKNVSIDRKDQNITMGEFIEINARSGNIRDSIYPLEFSPPNQVMLNIITFLQEQVDRITTVTELFSGAPAKSDTTATASQIALEKGSELFTSIQKEVHKDFGNELQAIAQLNSIFLDEKEYVEIVFDENDPRPVKRNIGRKDYQAELMYVPVSDPSIVSQRQVVAKADFLNQIIAQNPFLAQDPRAIEIGMKGILEAVGIPNKVQNDLTAIMRENAISAQQQQNLASQQEQVQGEEQQISQANQQHQALLEEEAQIQQEQAEIDAARSQP